MVFTGWERPSTADYEVGFVWTVVVRSFNAAIDNAIDRRVTDQCAVEIAIHKLQAPGSDRGDSGESWTRDSDREPRREARLNDLGVDEETVRRSSYF
jgi:hypothetical protein